MNKRQAKAYVLRCMASEARHHPGNASEWLLRPLRSDGITVTKDGDFSQADQQRIEAALLSLADEMDRRAKRMRK